MLEIFLKLKEISKIYWQIMVKIEWQIMVANWQIKVILKCVFKHEGGYRKFWEWS